MSSRGRRAEIPGTGEDRGNRLAGLGPLAGIMTGAAVGVAAAFARPALARVPGPLFALGITKPADWAAADWAGDVIPHLGYGAATYGTLSALSGRGR